MSLKDNCLAKSLVALAKTGINSLKIEGRMKTLHYLATVVNSYRHLLDNFPPANKYLKE
ncbi:U32 family peptidase [bacterium]|nr:U32 family peptidase [bacterium]